MNPYCFSRLPLFSVLLLTVFGSLQAQSFRMEGAAIRQSFTLPAGAYYFSICNLTPGQSYTAVVSGLPEQASPEWLAAGTGINRGGTKQKGQILRFRATAPCTDLTLSTGLASPVQAYLSVSADANKVPPSGLAARTNNTGLSVSYAAAPADLIANTLFPNTCHIISNVSFHGPVQALGNFSNGQTNIGFSEGLVLATGDISFLEGPNTESNGGGGFGNYGPVDPDLAVLAQGGPQFDGASIEFDLTPSGSSLQFQFVFGSEEYCEYVGTSYSDVFGLFISGPGIAGVKNLAIIPGTALPVTINNVNHLINSKYYVNNSPFDYQCQSLPPFASDECQLDGWTTPLTAFTQVTPCATYHVKLAIADIGDGAWNSAVFLKAGAGNNSPIVKASVVYPNNQTVALENCKSNFIRFQRTGTSVALPVPVVFDVAGTATPGIDYEPLPNPVVIPAGQAEVLVPLKVFADLLAEGPETIELMIQNSCNCGQSITAVIENLDPLTVVNPDVSDCFSTVLSPTTNGGLPPYTYKWSNGATQETLPVFHPAGMQVYAVTVTDQCGNSQSASALVTLYQPPPPSIQIQFCAGDSIEVNGKVYTTTGVTTYVAPGKNGQCDTSMNIVVQAVGYINRKIAIPLCPGQSFSLGSNTYFAPDTILNSVQGTNGACDTTTAYVLVAAPNLSRSETLSFCQGASVTIGGTVYTSPGNVQLTIPGTGGACDTLVDYTLVVLPPVLLSDTLVLCPGETITFNGQSYTAPAVAQQTLPGKNGQCDTVLTHILRLRTPAPSKVTIACPAPVINTIEAGAALPVIAYAPPTASSDCPCPGMSFQQTAGKASGSAFPLGVTTNCFTAKDPCGNTASCCFLVTVKEKPACDAKTISCVKWEVLSIKEDAEWNTTFKIRVTNNCASPLVAAQFQLPSGVVAELPFDQSTYTAPSNREYWVNNPNFSLYYSIRFESQLTGIANGESDIFEYTLPPQAQVTFIRALVHLSPSLYYSTHLNTFNCFGNNQTTDRGEFSAGLRLFPNPADDILLVEVPAGASETLPVRILDAKGACVLSTTLLAGEGPQPVVLPDAMQEGMYLLEVLMPEGKPELTRFVVLRR